MNLTALEKVTRIGCKYELSIIFYIYWAPPSGGLAQGQLCQFFESLLGSHGFLFINLHLVQLFSITLFRIAWSYISSYFGKLADNQTDFIF